MCDFLHRCIVPPAPSERSDALELLVEALDEAVSAPSSPIRQPIEGVRPMKMLETIDAEIESTGGQG